MFLCDQPTMKNFYKMCDVKYAHQLEQVDRLSHTEATRVAMETTAIHDIIGQDGDHLACGNNWMVLPVNTECIKLLLYTHDTMVTWDDRNRKSSLNAFSYSSILRVNCGIRLDIHYFGKEYEMCLAHYAAHFKHVIERCTTKVIPMMLHMPKDFDKERLEKELVGHLGQRFQYAEDDDPTEGFIFTHRMPEH